MKRGIEVRPDYDPAGQWILKIRKTRGRLTLEEIKKACTEYEQDFYMLVIRAMDEDISQYYAVDDFDGDFVTVYSAEEFFKWREK